MQKDLVICQIPFTGTDYPLMAGAVLKGIADKAGWSSIVYDFNKKYYEELKQHELGRQVTDWLMNETPDIKILDYVKQMFDHMSDKIISHNPKLVAISLFSYCCKTSAIYLSMMIKQKNPKIKIIAGGSGLYDGVEMKTDFADHMKRMKLFDHYIIGDADHSFYEFLTNNKNFAGIDSASWEPLSNDALDTLTYPNYDDHDWSMYQRVSIPITGSRGCVRKCNFCNDILHWKKFSFRTAESIFQEMLSQSEKYKIYHFEFSDALINGNVREFRLLCEKLAMHNKKTKNRIEWSSQFIFRPKNQFSEVDWDHLKESGAVSINVGVESLDENIRHDMGKKFNQSDLEFNLAQCKRLNLPVICNVIVGYPLEDQTSIDKSKKWLEDNTQFNDIMILNLGGTMAIFPDTILWNNMEKYNITLKAPTYNQWRNHISTPSLRKKWWQELYSCAKQNGFQVLHTFENSIILEGLTLHEST